MEVSSEQKFLRKFYVLVTLVSVWKVNVFAIPLHLTVASPWHGAKGHVIVNWAVSPTLYELLLATIVNSSHSTTMNRLGELSTIFGSFFFSSSFFSFTTGCLIAKYGINIPLFGNFILPLKE